MTFKLAAILLLLAAPLPESVYSDLAASAPIVTIPQGRWTIAKGRELRPARSNLVINGQGAILVPDSAVSIPFWITSQTVGGLTYFGVQEGRRHGEGKCESTSDTLTVKEIEGLNVGDVVLLRMGVNWSDPNEPEYVIYRQVAAIDGHLVRFTQPFGRPTTIYESYEELADWSLQPEKCGPWGLLPSGGLGRGLGTSHDVYAFAGGRPLENITVVGLTVELPLNAQAYGAAAFAAAHTRNVTFRDCTVINPAGSAGHLAACEATGYERFAISGVGRSTPSAGGGVFPVNLISMWSGRDCFVRGLDSRVDNVALVNVESGTVNTKLSDINVVAGKQSWSQPIVGVYGNHPGFEISRARFDLPLGTLMFGGTTDLTVRDIVFVREEFPDWIPFQVNWQGTTTVGSKKFGPLEKLNLSFTAEEPLLIVPRPLGLYRSAQIVLSKMDRENCRAITAPGDGLGPNPNQLTLPLTSSDWTHGRPGTLDEHFEKQQVVIWPKPGKHVSFEFHAEYYPLLEPAR